MSSQKQIEANRQNALRSTGPRTPAGRGASALNAVKHGLLSRQVVLETEGREEFDMLLMQLYEQMAPVGVLERALVERIAGILWRLRRLGRVEAETIAAELCRQVADRAEEDVKRLQKYDENGELHLDDDRHAVSLRVAAGRAIEALKRLRGPDFALSSAFARALGNGGGIEPLSRYETTLERSLFRTLHELERLQSSRSGGIVLPRISVDVSL